MRHSVITAILLLSCITTVFASDLPDEDLSYVILYKWGLVNKEAATATLSLRKNANTYSARLSAETVPWADRVFKVRDTLQSVMMHRSCLPLLYRKTTHEGGTYNRDVVNFSRTGNQTTGTVERVRRKKGGDIRRSDTILHADGPSFDMLSVFYYLRQLDFPNLAPGYKTSVYVFSGKRVEELTIVFSGKETIKFNGKSYPTYVIDFSFTQNGKPTGWPMTTWISQDESRIPIKLEGQLPFGKVHAFYTGAMPM